MNQEKREHYAQVKASYNAKKINIVRESFSKQVESKHQMSFWTNAFRDSGVEYIYKIASELRKLGYLKRFIDDENEYDANLFEFSEKPVYYKDLLPIFREIYDYNNRYNKKEKMKERPRTFSIANHGVSILDEVNEIDKFTDKELVLELRKRGFDVKAEKVVKTIL